VETKAAVVVKVPGVVAASHSTLVVAPVMAGSAPAHVPLLSSHAACVPSQTAPSQVAVVTAAQAVASASTEVAAVSAHVPCESVQVPSFLQGVVPHSSMSSHIWPVPA
jgi:hypothetical protein